MAERLASNLILIMIGIVLKRWRADICKDYSLRIRKAQVVCSLHIHLSCPAVWHRMRFRQCDLVPNSCLDTTFQIRVQNPTIYVGGAALLVIRPQSMDFCILSSADRRRHRRRHARQDTICAIISEDFKSFSSVEMPLLRKNGPTQLHRLGGPSRLRPRLTDTDSESPLLRSARRNQRCFAGVRPEATRPSLAFHSRRWAIDYLRE